MTKQSRFKKYYTGYPVSGIIYRRVLAKHIKHEHLILDFGAGRGLNNSTIPKANTVYGVDVDEAIFENARLTKKALIVDGNIPFDNDLFDIVVSSWVLEHIDNPEQTFKEVSRVLKPGGKFIFLTCSKYHYVSLIAAYTPQWFHEFVIPKVRGRASDDVFPTTYKVNSKSTVHEFADKAGLKVARIIHYEPPPVYMGFSWASFHLGRYYQKLVSKFNSLSGLRHGLIGIIVKPIQ